MELQIQDRAMQKIKVRAKENDFESFDIEVIIQVPMKLDSISREEYI